MEIVDIIKLLSNKRFILNDEKELQKSIEDIFKTNSVQYEREYMLDKKNKPDFFINGIAIEVKIKGSAKSIYKQCERYCAFEQVKFLILVTGRSMGFPADINGKDCYVLNLGKAWL